MCACALGWPWASVCIRHPGLESGEGRGIDPANLRGRRWLETSAAEDLGSPFLLQRRLSSPSPFPGSPLRGPPAQGLCLGGAQCYEALGGQTPEPPQLPPPASASSPRPPIANPCRRRSWRPSNVGNFWGHRCASRSRPSRSATLPPLPPPAVISNFVKVRQRVTPAPDCKFTKSGN